MVDSMEKIVNLCKQRGYVYPGSEIYGGLANTWDYGPYGAELKNNIKKAWWKKFIQENKDSYGVDAAILMNPRVWEASGHVGSFSDPLIDCKECKTRHRADKLIESFTDEINPDTLNDKELYDYIVDHKIPCPNCGKVNYTQIREFNLMFETKRGVVKDQTSIVYLRPETAQGEFVNFLNVARTSRSKIPFGIGQIGKAFRNEITPGNFTFRTIEFEQMEHQWFCKEGTDSKYYEEYKEKQMNFITSIGIDKDHLRFKDHEKFSGKEQKYLDPETNEKYIPYVVESTVGLDRTVLAVLCESYYEETLEDGTTREVMRFSPYLAPYKVSILPLIKKNHADKAKEVYKELSKYFMCTYDESGNIGKRYRRSDVIGTPFAITIDDETINNNTVTIRDRDTMKQITLNLDEVKDYVLDKINF